MLNLATLRAAVFSIYKNTTEAYDSRRQCEGQSSPALAISPSSSVQGKERGAPSPFQAKRRRTYRKRPAAR